MNRPAVTGILLLIAAAFRPAIRAEESPSDPAESPIRILVIDPLAAPLSCACVKGLGQRDYSALGK